MKKIVLTLLITSSVGCIKAENEQIQNAVSEIKPKETLEEQLSVAIEKLNFDLVRYLIAQGADYNMLVPLALKTLKENKDINLSRNLSYISGFICIMTACLSFVCFHVDEKDTSKSSIVELINHLYGSNLFENKNHENCLLASTTILSLLASIYLFKKGIKLQSNKTNAYEIAKCILMQPGIQINEEVYHKYAYKNSMPKYLTAMLHGIYYATKSNNNKCNEIC